MWLIVRTTCVCICALICGGPFYHLDTQTMCSMQVHDYIIDIILGAPSMTLYDFNFPRKLHVGIFFFFLNFIYFVWGFSFCIACSVRFEHVVNHLSIKVPSILSYWSPFFIYNKFSTICYYAFNPHVAIKTFSTKLSLHKIYASWGCCVSNSGFVLK